MNRGVTFDLTTRITGYQASLAKMKQAIEQLDPGSKISKSMQAAYKTAESYIQRLSKTPVVNITSDSQLQRLNQHLQTANELINNVNNGIQSASTADFKAEGMEQAVKDLEQLNAQIETLSGGPKLTDLSQNADMVAKTFAEIGKKVEGLSAAQGLDILNKKLEEAQKRSSTTKSTMEQAQAKINSWKPTADSTMFSSKSGGVGTKLLKELNVKVTPHIDIDFSKQGGFSPEAISQLREQLMAQLRSQLTTQQLQDSELQTNITNAFSNMFNESLTANNIKSRLGSLYDSLGAALNSDKGISNLLNFGNANINQVTNNIAEQLKASTIQAIPYAERLREILDSIVKHGAASETNKANILGNINSGEFEAARKAMVGLLEANKQLHTKPPADLTAELQKATQDYNNATVQVKKFQQARNAITDSPEFKQMAAEVEQLKTQVADLIKQLHQARGKSEQFGKSLAQSSAGSVQNYALTTQELQKYSQQLERIKAQEKFVGKLEGVVARWFSVYAVVNKVTQAIRNMISTVKQLDKTITNIAIVTSMSQGDLWGQMPQYTQMARDYAASISGVYEVSQLYYQQGGLIFDFFPKICYNIASK